MKPLNCCFVSRGTEKREEEMRGKQEGQKRREGSKGVKEERNEESERGRGEKISLK